MKVIVTSKEMGEIMAHAMDRELEKIAHHFCNWECFARGDRY